jgi:hypothetical protein
MGELPGLRVVPPCTGTSRSGTPLAGATSRVAPRGGTCPPFKTCAPCTRAVPSRYRGNTGVTRPRPTRGSTCTEGTLGNRGNGGGGCLRTGASIGLSTGVTPVSPLCPLSPPVTRVRTYAHPAATPRHARRGPPRLLRASSCLLRFRPTSSHWRQVSSDGRCTRAVRNASLSLPLPRIAQYVGGDPLVRRVSALPFAHARPVPVSGVVRAAHHAPRYLPCHPRRAAWHDSCRTVPPLQASCRPALVQSCAAVARVSEPPRATRGYARVLWWPPPVAPLPWPRLYIRKSRASLPASCCVAPRPPARVVPQPSSSPRPLDTPLSLCYARARGSFFGPRAPAGGRPPTRGPGRGYLCSVRRCATMPLR